VSRGGIVVYLVVLRQVWVVGNRRRVRVDQVCSRRLLDFYFDFQKGLNLRKCFYCESSL